MRSRFRHFLHWFKWYILVPLARIVGAIRPARQIVSVWPEGPVALPPQVVLFMHFDAGGGIRRQMLDYLQEFTANGRAVVFVTNSGRLTKAAMAALQPLCAAIIIRKNIGYDFGAWRDALEAMALPRADTTEVILANDSVLGPLTPLGDVLRRFDYERADFWGLTESWQERYHLQSFFLAFGPAALQSEAFAKFWRRVRPVPVKAFIVHHYEIGITQAMMKGGLRGEALWRYDALVRMIGQADVEKYTKQEDGEKRDQDPVQITRKLQVLRIRDAVARRMALNPTSDLWRQLLLTGFPFIKRELLRINPTRVEDVGDWVEVVKETLAADPDPILQDLRTMLKGGAP